MPAKSTSSFPAATKAPLASRSGLMLSATHRGELKRAVIVFELYAFAEANPKLGRQAVVNVVLLSHAGEPGISERTLWRWIAAFEKTGLAALVDHKPGNSGRHRGGEA